MNRGYLYGTLCGALLSCALITPQVSRYLLHRPSLEKVGYAPHPRVIRMITADQKPLAAVNLILKVLFRSGGPTLKGGSSEARLEFDNAFLLLKSAVKLDPYNMDGYYVLQAMAWDRENVEEINGVLEEGMRYRTWDFYLPFFVAFNSSYFLKDYAKAARFFHKARQLTGSDLFGRLASRYLYEAGETDLAIEYLEMMIQQTQHRELREKYQVRLAALREVKRIEEAVKAYEEATGRQPAGIAVLVTEGYLSPPPRDPYGGTFYLDENGKVRTTSKFAFGRGRTHHAPDHH